MMAEHPHIQARLQREIDKVLGEDPERDVSYEDLADLKYVEACLKETLRCGRRGRKEWNEDGDGEWRKEETGGSRNWKLKRRKRKEGKRGWMAFSSKNLLKNFIYEPIILSKI